MTYVGVILPWLSSLCSYVIPSWATTKVVNGYCMHLDYWPTKALDQGFHLFLLLWQTILPLIVFVICYSKIIGVIQHQAKVTGTTQATQNATTTAAQKPQVSQTQKNVVKTMIYVTACFGICWVPVQMYLMLRAFDAIAMNMRAYLVLVVVAYVNLSLNPFLYASHYEGVKKSWHALLRRLKIEQDTPPGMESTAMPRSTAGTVK
jgi:hypothetical protein